MDGWHTQVVVLFEGECTNCILYVNIGHRGGAYFKDTRSLWSGHSYS